MGFDATTCSIPKAIVCIRDNSTQAPVLFRGGLYHSLPNTQKEQDRISFGLMKQNNALNGELL